MKKNLNIFLTALLMLSLFSGCREKASTVPGTEPTVPIATVAPTQPVTTPSRPAPARPEPVHRETAPAVLPGETAEATIEDGNGPIPSQNPTARRK